MIPKNNNFTLTIQNPCVEYLQYLEKANCGVFLIGGHCYSRFQIWKIKDDKKKIMIANQDFTLNSAKKRIPI